MKLTKKDLKKIISELKALSIEVQELAGKIDSTRYKIEHYLGE